MKTLIRAFFGVACLGLCLGCASSKDLPQYPLEPAGLGETFNLTLRDHATEADVSLSSLRGRVVVLDVWATWCKPCRESLPELQQAASEFEENDIAVVTVNIDEENGAVGDFVQKFDLSLPVWRDPEGNTLRTQFRFEEAPTTFVIDKRGVPRFIHSGQKVDTLAQVSLQAKALARE